MTKFPTIERIGRMGFTQVRLCRIILILLRTMIVVSSSINYCLTHLVSNSKIFQYTYIFGISLSITCLSDVWRGRYQNVQVETNAYTLFSEDSSGLWETIEILIFTFQGKQITRWISYDSNVGKEHPLVKVFLFPPLGSHNGYKEREWIFVVNNKPQKKWFHTAGGSHSNLLFTYFREVFERLHIRQRGTPRVHVLTCIRVTQRTMGV